ncbi:hypothetical protein ACSET8_02595 [Pseudomonas aeruginosa]|uniref:hypothetical protein n=1 Tax=Pseudomonas aeruginosa TaxID=287 RepID=UPI001A238B74|nr:hypothetical protein [Pseudomonas aeruginosa]MBH3499153.1 hypothetical protein [Pseudomonas aeruginosa]MBV5888755.1 hypothetical protein [Pseudomonas aeruginosa]MDA3430822.1 hypothetical protein [Pseudomonas aeruginosa]MDU0508418.1 hypothetical protein [Pseudomonas aeruginosa]HEJ5564194.1 hypothetical protein [Pseudomonas aeruginosa]
MSALEFDDLPEWVKERIDALAKQHGWSIERCMEEIVIEGTAMGGLTSAGRPKAKVVQLRTEEGLKGD